MDLLTTSGRTIYGALTMVAFLSAAGVSYIAAFSFAIDAPPAGEPGFLLARLVLSVILIGTAAHLASVLGSKSRVRVFPKLSIIGSVFLLIPLVRFSTNITVAYAKHDGARDEAAGALLMITPQAVVLIFSVMKLRQLRIPR